MIYFIKERLLIKWKSKNEFKVQKDGEKQLMSFTKIPSNMLKPLPSELIPEIIEAREGYTTLLEHLKNLKQLIDAINFAIESGQLGIKNGVIVGTITFADGAVIPSSKTLMVEGITQLNGTTNLDGGVSSISQISTAGNFGINAVVAHVNEFALKDSINQILQFIPTVNSNFLIYIYMRVNDSTPQVSMNVQYTDVGGDQDHLVLNNVIQYKNSYSVAPIFINAIANKPITLSASANVLNQVFVSASIVGL